jgi:thromboxane-A synthase
MRGSPEAAARHPYAFLPFGLGPRKCLGYRLATEEGVLVLARLLARFEFSLDGERHAGPLDVRSAITMAPRDGIWLRARERGAGE